MYFPTPADIVQVSVILASMNLSEDLVDEILEEAEYWARITTTLDISSGNEEKEDYCARGKSREHVLILRSKPICSAAADGADSTANVKVLEFRREVKPGLMSKFTDLVQSLNPFGAVNEALQTTTSSVTVVEPRDYHPVRRITWRITSCDQGWCDKADAEYDTYERSWTGFRGNVLRYVPSERTSSQDPQAKHYDAHISGEYCQISSQQYLSAWANLQSRNGEEAMKVDDAGQLVEQASIENIGRYIEGESEELKLRVWPRATWDFRGTQIQLNRRAVPHYMEHIIIWDARDSIMPEDANATAELVKKGRGIETGDGRQVRALCRGDIVELHSFAFHPMWCNNVKDAQMVIEFAI